MGEEEDYYYYYYYYCNYNYDDLVRCCARRTGHGNWGIGCSAFVPCAIFMRWFRP